MGGRTGTSQPAAMIPVPRPGDQRAADAVVAAARHQRLHPLLQRLQQLLHTLPRLAGDEERRRGLRAAWCWCAWVCCCCCCCDCCRGALRRRRSCSCCLLLHSPKHRCIQQVCLIQHPQLRGLRRQRQAADALPAVVQLRPRRAACGCVGCVGHVHNHVCLLSGCHGAPHALRLDGAVGLAQARAVYEHDFEAVQLQLHLHHVARGARHGGHNGRIGASQQVEQRALARVGRPHNRDAHAAPAAQRWVSAGGAGRGLHTPRLHGAPGEHSAGASHDSGPHLTSSPQSAAARWPCSSRRRACTRGTTPAATSSAISSSSPKSITASSRAAGHGPGRGSQQQLSAAVESHTRKHQLRLPQLSAHPGT